MKSAEGGRICGKCNKLIFDFSKKNWKEIREIQSANNNSVCGMYSEAQLKYWGSEVPRASEKFTKAALASGMALALSGALEANEPAVQDTIIISGHVTDYNTGEELPFVKVELIGKQIATYTDFDGDFKLILTNHVNITPGDSLRIEFVGYSSQVLPVSDFEVINSSNPEAIQRININLVSSESQITAFYVERPSFWQRLKWKVKRVFRKPGQ
ncbi:MAG: carboxypeptidase-like regulatory domain-containing protein [Bacteroidetes bacterium]|nr:carboxypeptidase-like regulatory domain-containing protein [Bacteroidota bacterium]